MATFREKLQAFVVFRENMRANHVAHAQRRTQARTRLKSAIAANAAKLRGLSNPAKNADARKSEHLRLRLNAHLAKKGMRDVPALAAPVEHPALEAPAEHNAETLHPTT